MSPRRLALCALIVLSPALMPAGASAAAFSPQVGDRSRDVTIPGTGLPLQFNRTYNNLDQGLMGTSGAASSRASAG